VKLDFRARKYIVKELCAGVSASKLAAVYHVSRVHVYRLARQPDLHEKPVGNKAKKSFTANSNSIAFVRAKNSFQLLFQKKNGKGNCRICPLGLSKPF
jgi:hypothetical protein